MDERNLEITSEAEKVLDIPFHSNIPEHLNSLFPQQQNVTTTARRILLLTFLLNLHNKIVILTFSLLRCVFNGETRIQLTKFSV